MLQRSEVGGRHGWVPAPSAVRGGPLRDAALRLVPRGRGVLLLLPARRRAGDRSVTRGPPPRPSHPLRVRSWLVRMWPDTPNKTPEIPRGAPPCPPSASDRALPSAERAINQSACGAHKVIAAVGSSAACGPSAPTGCRSTTRNTRGVSAPSTPSMTTPQGRTGRCSSVHQPTTRTSSRSPPSTSGATTSSADSSTNSATQPDEDHGAPASARLNACAGLSAPNRRRSPARRRRPP